MSDREHSNGGAAAQLEPDGEVITIVLIRHPWGVSVNSPATEPLACLAALRTACDELEAHIRLGRVQRLQMGAAENARVAAILAKGKGAFQP